MKINFSAQLKNNGVPLKNEDKDIVLSDICTNACFAVVETDKQLNGSQKYELYRLGNKIAGGGEIDVTAEEVSKLKERVGQAYTQLVVGLTFDLLEDK